MPTNRNAASAAFFAFFLVSGFCGLVYQVVWLRLAMASFGVTAPLVALVVSVFMAGLALGSWTAGRLARRLQAVTSAVPVRLYAAAEIVVAASATAVPLWLDEGRLLLAQSGADWGSLAHYAAAGLWITLGLLPFCAAMGMTYPLAVWALRYRTARGSFGFLYVANVIGACLGTLASAFVLIEILGFRGTLAVAALLNSAIAAAALALSLTREEAPTAEPAPEPSLAGGPEPWTRTLLFTTGFASMGMEVVWVRQFTPYLGTAVYAFATILAIYLAATSAGTLLYRRRERRRPGCPMPAWAWAWLGVLGLLPLFAGDPRLPLPHLLAGVVRLALGVAPFSLALGFLTPLLIDRYARNDANRVGSAYAVNITGCILGPLASGFLLLPLLGDSASLLMLAGPLFILGGLRVGRGALPALLPAATVAAVLIMSTRDFETIFPQRRVLRDYAATVVATGSGTGRRLLVNGVGMTALVPCTKMMAHLPAAFCPLPPRRSLVICFGMGTTFRSLLAWQAPTTAVELIPSVPALFGYFHEDAAQLLASPNARIVIDDGRRFLERDREQYDVITLDPPPPFEAAGSSLLYSKEFLALARQHLAPNGVLQHWIPLTGRTGTAACARALVESFPHVRVFRAIKGGGLHFLASTQPTPRLSAAELARRLPPAAVRDLLEWGPASTAEQQFAMVLAGEVPPTDLLALDPLALPIQDDRPVNEYYLLRSWGLLRAHY